MWILMSRRAGEARRILDRMGAGAEELALHRGCIVEAGQVSSNV
jgi:hypothetical protein